MNQPLHNNAIPAHPGVRAAIGAAESGQSSAPSVETPPSAPQGQALWDAFEGADSTPAEAPPPPPSVAPSAPAMPAAPAELPPSVDELLGGGASAPAPEPEFREPVAQQPQQFEQHAQAPSAQPIDMGALQQQAIDFLMANEYKLDDASRTQLISEPDVVLPKLAARMHVGIATQLARQVAQAIPAMIQQHLETHVKSQKAEMEFFSRYPKLNRDEWKPVIAESLQMYRQMNPNANREEVITRGAALAAFQIQSRYNTQNRPVAPPQPGRSAQQPYVPMAPGGGAQPPNNQQGTNIWSDLAADPDWNPW